MDYSQLISESEAFLQSQEHQASRAQVRDRIRFLRVLKTGQAKTQSAAGLLIGIATRQSQRLWQTYREKGYCALLSTHYQHSFGKLSGKQISLLLTFLRSDQASKLEDVQAFLDASFGVHYTLSGLSKLFTRLKIKRTPRGLKLVDPAMCAKMPTKKKLLKKLCPLNPALC